MVAELAPPAPASTLAVDLAAAGRLRGLAAGLLAGRDAGLLAPLRFRPPGTLPAAAALTAEQIVGRRQLAPALAAANRGWGHPSADRLAARFADPGTRVVVTGQQPGLLGGPLYSLTKAIAAVTLAEQLERRGEPAVAVFWMASEDHDWTESTTVGLPAPWGPRRLDLGPDPEPLAPLALRRLGPRIGELFAALAASLPGEADAERLTRLAAMHHPEATFAEAFAGLMVALLGERAPLLLDAAAPALKEAERPWLRRLIDGRAELASAQERADAAVLAAGYPLQVAPQPGASPLFLLTGRERRRIVWTGAEHWSLRGADLPPRPLAELVARLDDDPTAISPGVLARPAIQDAVLGSSLLVLGPGELAYLPQVAPAYDLLGIPGPAATLRPQAIVLDTALAAHLPTLASELAANDPATLLARLLAGGELGPPGGGETAFLVAPREAIRAALATLAAPALALDAHLERPLEKTGETIERALDTFAAKVEAAAARQDATRAGRLARLRDACLPLGELQERFAATALLALRHGEGLVDQLFASLGDDPLTLRVIVAPVEAR